MDVFETKGIEKFGLLGKLSKVSHLSWCSTLNFTFLKYSG